MKKQINRMSMKNKSVFGIFFCFLIINVSAQNFRWKTDLDSVTKKGFYNILLSPTISSQMKDDFSDIRIYDQNNVEIPFLLKVEEPDDDSELIDKKLFFELSDFKISQCDSAEVKRSFVKISFSSKQYIDRLEIEIEGPSFFLRRAFIAEPILEEEIYAEDQEYFESIQNFELSSADSNHLLITNFRAKEFHIIIENEDNQPLKVSSVKMYQTKKYLTALLEKEGKYVLKFGDVDADEPRYDLKYFENSIPANISELSTGELIELFPAKEKEIDPETMNNKTILWVVISIIVVILGILSIKMVKDLKNNDKKY